MRVILLVSFIFTLLQTVNGQGHIHKLNTPFEQLKVSGNIHLRLIPSETCFLEFETESFPESLMNP